MLLNCFPAVPRYSSVLLYLQTDIGSMSKVFPYTSKTLKSKSFPFSQIQLNERFQYNIGNLEHQQDQLMLSKCLTEKILTDNVKTYLLCDIIVALATRKYCFL